MLTQRAVIFFFVIFILIIGFAVGIQKESSEKTSTGTVPVDDPVDDKALEVGEISVEEKLQIEDWIQENDLNQYGDAKDTAYIGGTPLFDEATGKSIDKYEYILRNYPDRPWEK